MIPLFKPFMPSLPELTKIMLSGELSSGKYTHYFEDSLKRYFSTNNILVTNTYSNAINVALTSADVKPGEEVIMSPMACLVSTLPYLKYGLKIKWCDINENTGTIDPEYLKKIVSNKTKVIVHNHFCGYPGYIDEVNEIAKKHGILVIDDAIEAFGSKYKNKKIGNCGTDITIFSFSATRIPNTIDGGAIIFKNQDLYERGLLLRDNGIDRNKFRNEIGEIDRSCDITLSGYNATMSNVNAYIGLEQMKYLDSLLEKQYDNAQKLYKLCKDENDISIIQCDFSKPNYWVYGLLSNNKKETILRFREKGLGASGVHINNNIYSIFDNDANLKGVETFNNKFLALPSGWWAKY